MTISKEQLNEAVRKAAQEGRLTCEKAHDLGRKLGVPLEDIGKVCNELQIKIQACQLGCF